MRFLEEIRLYVHDHDFGSALRYNNKGRYPLYQEKEIDDRHLIKIKTSVQKKTNQYGKENPYRME